MGLAWGAAPSPGVSTPVRRRAISSRALPFLRQHPELLRRFRAGERAALEQVYWAYVGDVERIARHGFAVRDKGLRVDGAPPAELGDLVQEVFARAFAERARLAYDGLRDYGAYLATIARNLLADRARRGGREVPLGPVELEQADEAPDEAPWADEATVRVVEGYLAGLPEELRALHEQRYVRGLPQVEAARVLGITRQQLRTREARLRDGLARALARAGITPGGG